MAPANNAGAPAQQQRRSRKSIAHMPSPENPPTIADKENITTDVSSFTALGESSAPAGKASRKSRSKSIGPGGLIEATGNRRKSAVPVGVKSILLPTIPLSPLQEIPSHASSRKPQKDNEGDGPTIEPTRQVEGDSGLYPRIPVTLQNGEPSKASAPVSGLANLQNPFASTPATKANETKVTLKTEEEQQAAAREREEKEKREAERNEILQRRDARRKSLANRRVSFAPEATLHTWDVVEYIQDSTTSSASTNSTRRASAMSTASAMTQSPAFSSDPSEPPSTPPEQVEGPNAILSPVPQRQLHQKKRRRRSSAIPPMNFNNPEEEEEFSSSPFSGSSTAGSDETENHTFLTANEDNSSASGTESADEGGSTILSLDEGDMTNHSSISGRSSGGSSNGSTRRLEDALRLAAQQAGTQGIEYDENGDLSMELVNEEITTAFQPWVKKLSASTAKDLQDLTSFQDQENQNPFPSSRTAETPSASAKIPENTADENEEMSMDITRAVGSILNTQSLGKAVPSAKRRKSVAAAGRRSSVNRRRSSGDSSSLGDETMDFTTAIGGIQGGVQQLEVEDTINGDEDLTMELTSVIGKVLSPKHEVAKRRRSSAGRQLLQEARRRESELSLDDDMDVTTAIGQILPLTTGEEVDHKHMDLAAGVGGILPPGTRSEAKAIMERETDFGEITSSPFQAEVPPSSPPKSAIGVQVTATASATGSPSLSNAKAKAVARKSLGGGLSATPRTGASTRKRASLSGTPTTPSKQLTPHPPKPTTPAKTPTPKSITFRSASPKKLFKEELKITPRSTPLKPIFTHNSKTGSFTPSVILTPRPRRSSGLGIDKEGLGSPRVAALLDRRRSIGEDATAFVPSLGEGAAGTVHFEDPRVMELEFDKERQEEEKRQNERKARSVETDEEKDATINLKEMIKSLTPKKKVNGRKSLAVGAARGLLGKRPAELDNEEDESDGSAKKLRVGNETSPVKSVKLRPPPSKIETTGRITRRSLIGASPSTTPTCDSPTKNEASTSPGGQKGSEDVEAPPSPAKHISKPVALNDDSQPEEEAEGKIHLQDFLNLTSIRFMELNTTKRRYTVAPNSMIEGNGKSQPFTNGSSVSNDDTRRDLESCIVAGACTIPMLELYQHSCHELKKYISEGRRIVREIEADTYEENPPLFREYISAPPDVKYIMDNQFKNVKTHARLLSKATWYEWRMGLLCGLQEGLDKARQDMGVDEEALRQQEELLTPMLPALVEKNKELESQYSQLQARADELANCDQEELQAARDELRVAEAEILAKKTKLGEMQDAVARKDEDIKTARGGIEECKKEIAEAERLREELRGWSSAEVGALKANVDALEKEYGWTIKAVSGSTLTMTYHRDIQLTFDISSFLPNDGSRPATKPGNSPIELSYTVGHRGYHAQELTASKNFVLVNLRALLGGLQQSATKVKDLLAIASEGWNKAKVIEEDIRMLNLYYPTEAVIPGDGRGNLLVKSILLLPSRTTKVEVVFNVAFGAERSSDAVLAVEPKTRVIYGEQLDERKMSEFLAGKIAGTVLPGEQGGWGVAVRALGERLVGKGKKA